MAELLARGTGSNIWLAVQDEGFGTLDPDNLEIAKTTLRNIAERRGLFVVISHVPGMSEVADHVLRVVDDGGTSRVEVI
jgi:DNA repair exonuclease SbcCD ATPase subunit